MKKIEIVEVDNGYVVTVTNEGVQSIFDRAETKIANNQEELLEIVRLNTKITT